MALPRSIARFNKRYTNRFIEPVVRRMSGFVIVHHRGRTTGVSHQTPLYTFGRRGETHYIVLTYGPAADWIQNVLATGGVVQRQGLRQQIKTVQLVHRRQAWPHLSFPVRLALTVLGVSDCARIDLEPITTP